MPIGRASSLTLQYPGPPFLIVPAGKLINRQLRDERGFDAGRIDAVVLDTQNGAVDFVLIAGERAVRFEW